LARFLKNGGGGVRLLKKCVENYRNTISLCEQLPDELQKLTRARVRPGQSFDLIVSQARAELEGPDRLRRILASRPNLEDVPLAYLEDAAARGLFRTDLACIAAVDAAVGPIIRKRELVLALGQVGLTLRADSKLCHGFIRAGRSENMQRVVTTMVEMDWLFRNTNYKSIMGSSMLAAWSDHRYPPTLEVMIAAC
jgi:hypothetical protein